MWRQDPEIVRVTHRADPGNVGATYHVPHRKDDRPSRWRPPVAPIQTIDPSKRPSPVTGDESTDLKHLRFEERLVAASSRHLLSHEPPVTDGHDPATSFTIHLATLERMNLHQLQKELVEVVHRIIKDKRATGGQMRTAKTLLAEYCTYIPATRVPSRVGYSAYRIVHKASAIRDYDLMIEKRAQAEKNDSRDPFEIVTRDCLSLYLMDDIEVIPTSTSDHPVRLSRPDDRTKFKEGYNILPGASRGHYNARIDLAFFWQRITMGFLGGLALIGPMLFMVLYKDLLATLLTVSVSTIVFAAALAFFTQLRGETVLASVAAYAAVLVVFVGSSS